MLVSDIFVLFNFNQDVIVDARRVLIVDDDRDICEILTGHMINIFDDIQVACCYDGGKALKEINFGVFDYMIFDLKLPSVDGIELIKATKIKQGNENTEIFVVSGNIGWEIEESLKELDIKGTLHKPFTFQEVSDMIKLKK